MKTRGLRSRLHHNAGLPPSASGAGRVSLGEGIRKAQSSVCDEGPGQTAGELVSQRGIKETASDCIMKGGLQFHECICYQEAIAS